MLLFRFLQVLDEEIQARKAKIHLATWNGETDPLDKFFAGRFEEWQSYQTRKNFERSQVIALISLPGVNRWLFAGAYDSQGRRKVREDLYKYTLLERPGTEELKGRLVVEFERNGRAPYRIAERIKDQLQVVELYSKRLNIKEFPGYTRVNISKADLDLIVKQQMPTWRSALGAVKGVYVISDIKTGKLYVGSATGEDGLWGRWSDYSWSGHGGNRELIALLSEKGKGKKYVRHFRFAILETADTNTWDKEIKLRETHWKKVLLSREHGYNAN